MAKIALIGADGSGKTSIAKMLLENPPVRLKYLYMGLNIESSNHSLIFYKAIYYYKVYKHKKKLGLQGGLKGSNISLHDLDDERGPDKRGKLGATLRTLNRIAEHLYRELIAFIYQLKGNNILYDRHFLFDGALSETSPPKNQVRLSTRFYSWMLKNVLPKPDLTLFLYAPPEVLFSRKGEADLEYLRNKNQSFLSIGSKLKNFKRIDATQPIDKVFENVKSEIVKYCSKK